MVTQVTEKGLQWFQDARFGMIIHGGLYSLIGRGEWVMHHEKIPVPEYEKLVSQFDPIQFNADEWVQLAADAGQKYMVITSRHHDGFSMYDTALSDYKITNTPFQRDPLAELADACAKNGEVKLGFYVSLLDWHHPAYRMGKTCCVRWLTPFAPRACASGSTILCWIGTIRPTVSGKKVGWPGSIILASCMDRFANSAGIMARSVLSGSMVIGLAMPSPRRMPTLLRVVPLNMKRFTGSFEICSLMPSSITTVMINRFPERMYKGSSRIYQVIIPPVSTPPKYMICQSKSV